MDDDFEVINKFEDETIGIPKEGSGLLIQLLEQFDKLKNTNTTVENESIIDAVGSANQETSEKKPNNPQANGQFAQLKSTKAESNNILDKSNNSAQELKDTRNTTSKNISSETPVCCISKDFNLDKVLNALGAKKYFYEKQLSATELVKPTLSTDLPPIIKLARGLLHLDYSILFETEIWIKPEPMECQTIENQENLFHSCNEVKNDALHPLDCLLILLECSDDLLKQDLITKLAKCQIAIPLIVPNLSALIPKNRFSEWCLRRIGIAWKPQKAACQETELASIPSTFVSFIRISSSKMSKSRLASRVIQSGKDDKHCYFIDRGELKNASNKLLSKGLVDIFWSTPKGEVDDCFPSPIIVFNLHGCSSAFTEQMQFLCAVTHIIFVFIDDSFDHPNHCNQLEFIANSKLKVCFLYRFKSLDSQKRFEEALYKTNIIKEGRFSGIINIKNNNIEKVAAEIKGIIIRSEDDKQEQLSNIFKLAGNFNMLLDSTNSIILEAQKPVKSLNFLTNESQKDEIIQLQQYLHAIVPMIKDSKRLRNRGETPFETYINNIQGDIMELNLKQQRQLSDILQKQDNLHFILLQAFENASKTPEKMLIFLRLIGIMLDSQSRKALPDIRAHLVQLRENQLMSQKANDQLETQTAIKNALQQLQNASFGVEHLLREISTSFSLFQCIEGQISSRRATNLMKSLPGMHAQMFANGVPLEVMNGDCGFVDVQWLQKLFQELCKTVGDDERVCVVTVLGVQSSGKSTLLNIMFGINLSVSSGRCTKGVYAQLIELDQTYQIQLGCRYIIILDTEGLRAPELKVSKDLAANVMERDNELATFIIGLSDLTIINVMGETDVDIHETLQITVYAMLRMKSVDLSPMCLMVHQNVNDTLIKENSMQARENIKNFLDMTTTYAARLEGSENTVRRFADVIDFNCADPNHICYLPSLFSGTHINPKYVSKVNELRSTVLQRLEKKANRFITFPQLTERIKALWNSILEEDFVFSFKNALAIQAHQQLENNVTKWFCALSKSSNEIISEVRNKIKQCTKEPVKLGQMLQEDFIKHMKLQLQQILDGEFLILMENQDNKILVQWKQNTIYQLQSYTDKLIEKNWRECSTYLQSKITDLDMADRTKQHEQTLRQIAKKQFYNINALTAKNLSEIQLKKEFESFWNNVLEELKHKCGITEIEKTDVNVSILDAIIGSGFIADSMQKYYYEIQRENPTIDAKDIAEQGWKPFAKQNHIGKVKDMFFFKDKSILNAKLTSMNMKWISWMDGMLAAYLIEARAVVEQPHRILNTIDVDMKQFEATEGIRFTGQYRALLAYTFYKKAIVSFDKQQTAHIQANDPLLRLELKFKDPFWSNFYATFKDLEAGHRIAESISEIVASSVTSEIEKNLPSLIEDFISTTDYQFVSNKFNFLATMIYDLGETLNRNTLREPVGQKAFEDLCSIFAAPFTFMEHYFTQKVESEYDSSKKNFEKKVAGKIKDYQQLLKLIIDQSVVSKTTIMGWLTNLQNEVNQSNKLVVDFVTVLNNSFSKDMEEIVIKNMNALEMEDFKDTVAKATSKRLQEVNVHLKRTHFTHAASKILSNRLLIGCQERCPFCGSICELGTEGHAIDHRCRGHWPQGLIRYSWKESQKLVIDICTSKVASSDRFRDKNTDGQFWPFKDYRKFYPNWDIPADPSLEGSMFWKWFLGHYGVDLAKKYNKQPPDVPKFWSSIEFEHAKAALEKEYNITIKSSKRSSALMTGLLHNIIGQVTAVEAAVNAIERKERGWERDDPNRPLVLMFLGPSGTGKTEMAKQISKYWNKKNVNAFIRLDMSEYHESHTVAKFIGSPPGYIGHGNTSTFVDKLKQHPTAVVLMDEIEKAHGEVFKVLFQMFDEGRLTNSQMNTISFPNAVFILTSNIASDLIAKHVKEIRSQGPTDDKIKFDKKFQDDKLRSELKKFLKHDALIGRIQEFICFVPFSNDDVEKLANIEMNVWQMKTLDKVKAKLMWGPDVVKLLAANFIYEEGMRSIQKAGEKYIATALSTNEANFREKSNVYLSVDGDPTDRNASIKVTITGDDDD